MLKVRTESSKAKENYGNRMNMVLSRKKVWKHLGLTICFLPHVLKTHIPDCFWLFYYTILTRTKEKNNLHSNLGMAILVMVKMVDFGQFCLHNWATSLLKSD